MTLKQTIKAWLVEVEPLSIGLIVIGGGILWQYGTDSILSAPRSYIQLVGAGCVTVGTASYLVEQGYMLTH